MRFDSRRVIALLAVASFLSAAPALAQEESGEDAGGRQFFGLTVGAKGGGGGNYLSKPEDIPVWLSGFTVPLEDGAGGWNGGGGLFVEFRVLRGYLGLEIDLLFESATNLCTIEYNDLVDTRWSFKTTNLRVPFLLTTHLGKKNTAFVIGLGPEIVAGLSASSSVEETTSGQKLLTPAQLSTMNELFSARTVTDTFFAVNLGVSIAVWKLAITVDLRLGFNLTQDKEFTKRVDYEQVNALEWRQTTEAAHSLDGKLMLGIGWDHGFDLPGGK